MSACLAGESQEQQAEHVKRSHHGGDHQNPENHTVISKISTCEDFVFAPKSGKRGNSGNCNGCDAKRPECIRHGFSEPAHFTHVLCADPVDDAACAQEEKRFKKCVSHQVESSGAHSSDTERRDHKPKLADG